NIDAIAVDIAFINDNVTDVDADAKFEPAILGNDTITLRHFVLYFHGATSGIDRAGKFNESGIPGSIDDAAAMFLRLQSDQFAAGLKVSESPFIIAAHETTVPGNISCEDGREPSLHSLFGHINSPINGATGEQFMFGGRQVSSKAGMSALG